MGKEKMRFSAEDIVDGKFDGVVSLGKLARPRTDPIRNSRNCYYQKE
jgi:hypothetical protein